MPGGGVIGKIIQTVISVGIGFVTGGPWGAALAFASSAIGFVLGAIAPKPKQPKLNTGGSLADRQQVIRQSVAPRDVVYGTAVKSGVLVYAESTGTGNKFLHLIIALTGHTVEALLDTWFTDEIIGDLDNLGVITTGRFAGFARIRTHLGADNQNADAAMVEESISGNWTDEHRLRGRSYIYPRLQWDATTYTNGIPNIKEKVVGRGDIFDPRDAQSRWTNNWALVIRDYLTRSKRDGGWGEASTAMDDDDFIAAANISDQMVDIVDERLGVTVDATADELTLSSSDAYVWACDGVQISFNSGGSLPGGLSAVVTYYWIETGQHTGKLATSLTGSRDRTAVNITSAGANVVLTRVSQPRYTCDGIYSMDENKMDVLEAMVQAGAGWIAKCQGKFRIWAGAEAEPEDELDGSWLRDGDIGLQTRPTRQDLFNTIRGTYIDPVRFWKENQFPNVTSDAYKSEDDGEELTQDFQFGWLINGERAQRVAAILLNKHRIADTLTLPCNWNAWPVRLGSILSVTLPIFGYEAALFRVMSWRRAEGFSGIDLVLQRDDPSSYDWTAGQAQTYAAAPPVSLFEPWNVPAPTALTITDDPIVATGGGLVQRMKATWTNADDAFVAYYDVEYKLHVDTDWRDGGSATVSPAWITPVGIGDVYDVRVTAVRANGARSNPAIVTSHTAGGDTTAPDAPTGVTATGESGGIELEWTNASQDDLTTVEVWRSATDDDTAAVKVADSPATPSALGSRFDSVGTGHTYFYFLKSRDSSGNVSPFTGSVTATSL